MSVMKEGELPGGCENIQKISTNQKTALLYKKIQGWVRGFMYMYLIRLES